MINHAEIYGYLFSTVRGYYATMDGCHDTEHFDEVFNAAQSIAKHLELTPDEKLIVLISAAYHDVGRLIEDKRHEEFSVTIFNNDRNMRRWLTRDERQIVSNTINEHRSSKGASSIYSKILKDADKIGSIDRDRLITRVVRYNIDHCDLDQTDPAFIPTVTKKVTERLGKLKSNRGWQLDATRELYGEKPTHTIPDENEVVMYIEKNLRR